MTSFLITFGAFAVATVLAFIVSRALTGVSRTIALRYGVVSLVTSRSSHTVPTPRLGGIGLSFGFLFGAALFLGVLTWLPGYMGEDPEAHAIVAYNPDLMFWLAIGWLGMFITGLLDDLFDLPPPVKLALMTMAALAPIVRAGVSLSPGQPGWMPTHLYALLTAMLALGWILFFTNAFNFMDGMDGFAANFARIAAMSLFLALLIPGMMYGTIRLMRGEAYLLPLIAMACWGFLYWNRPPAKVFMGDGGSLSLGYLLAIYPLLGEQGRFRLYLPSVVSITILMPFIFDVVLTLFRRALRGENILQAHREHLYQRLMRTGLSHARVLGLNMRIFIACGLLALVGHVLNNEFLRWLGFFGSIALMLIYHRMVLRREEVAAAMDNAIPPPATGEAPQQPIID